MEDKGLALAERCNNAVQEADEERGVGIHRARRVEQNDKAERLVLAPTPSEGDRRSPVRDAAMDRAPKIEPPPAPARAGTTHEADAHCAREASSERVDRRQLVRIGDRANILLSQCLGVGSFRARAWLCRAILLHVSGRALHSAAGR